MDDIQTYTYMPDEFHQNARMLFQSDRLYCPRRVKLKLYSSFPEIYFKPLS